MYQHYKGSKRHPSYDADTLTSNEAKKRKDYIRIVEEIIRTFVKSIPQKYICIRLN